jgi:hypothetical protein
MFDVSKLLMKSLSSQSVVPHRGSEDQEPALDGVFDPGDSPNTQLDSLDMLCQMIVFAFEVVAAVVTALTIILASASTIAITIYIKFPFHSVQMNSKDLDQSTSKKPKQNHQNKAPRPEKARLNFQQQGCDGACLARDVDGIDERDGIDCVVDDDGGEGHKDTCYGEHGWGG